MTPGPDDEADLDDLDDLALLGHLADELPTDEPAPTDLLRLTVDAAWQLRRTDATVAQLVGDEAAEAVPVRGERPGRFLTYAMGDVTLELDLAPDGRTVVGQLLPAERLAVAVVTGGDTGAVPVDDLGRFRLVSTAPQLVLRVEAGGRTFVTPPINR
jgi:hypothetical protein